MDKVDILGEEYTALRSEDDFVKLLRGILGSNQEKKLLLWSVRGKEPKEYPVLARVWLEDTSQGLWIGHDYLYRADIEEAYNTLGNLL